MHKLKMYKNSPKSNLSNAMKLEKSLFVYLAVQNMAKVKKNFLYIWFWWTCKGLY